MARPTLFTNRKFLRLTAILRLPKPYILGHLEYLWQSCYQSAKEVVGDAVDVELAAEWAGEQGVFTQALVDVGFVDVLDSGEIAIHDFWTHAPKYVIQRAETEERLRALGTSLSDVRREAGRKGGMASVASKRNLTKTDESKQISTKDEANGKQTGSKLLENSSKVQAKTSPPLPSPPFPSPTPSSGATSNDVSPEINTAKNSGDGYSESFLRFWSIFPNKVGKGAAWQAWKSRKCEQMAIEAIIGALEEQIRIKDHNRKIPGLFVPSWPNPATWISQKRWDDELKFETDRQDGRYTPPGFDEKADKRSFAEMYPNANMKTVGED